MPDISQQKTIATSYPPQTLYDSWREHAESFDLTISQYIIRMVEAGRKQIDFQEITNESVEKLRRQHADLQRELDRQRTRNRELERRLHRTAQTEILDFVEQNPGVGTPRITQHVADTVPGRVASYLDVLEGDELVVREGGYHRRDADSETKTSDLPGGSDE